MNANPLHLTRSGDYVLDRATWTYTAGRPIIAEPTTPAVTLDALSAVPVMAEALAAHREAVDTAEASEAAGLDLITEHEETSAAWRQAAQAGQTKMPKAPDLDATAGRALTLHARMIDAQMATRATSRTVDDAARVAALDPSARVTAHAHAVATAAAARVKVAEAEATVEESRAAFLVLSSLDGLALRASGRTASEIPTLLGNRLAPRPHDWSGVGTRVERLADRIARDVDLDTLATPAVEAVAAAERKAAADRHERSRYSNGFVAL